MRRQIAYSMLVMCFAASALAADRPQALVIGAHGEDFVSGLIQDAGAIHTIYGTINGLSSENSEFFFQGLTVESPEADDRFGWPLTSGDLDGDGYGDLLIGIPYENWPFPDGVRNDSGAIHMRFGQPEGGYASGTPGEQTFSLNTAEAGDRFGYAVAVGDFDDDGHEDYAVSAPNSSVGSIPEAGRVMVFYSTGERRISGFDYWSQAAGIVRGIPESGDLFGSALAVGDFNGDNYDDLAIGARGEAIGNTSSAGAVHILYGGRWGLTDAGNQLWTDPSGVEAFDQFGWALTSGDFDDDGYDDLAIGVPFENVRGVTQAGQTVVLYGTDSGLQRDRWQGWYQGYGGFLGAREAYDRLGWSVTAGDFNRDGFDDLVMGVPDEDIYGEVDAGAVQVLYGTSGGLTTDGNQIWHQNIGILHGACEDGDRFGLTVEAGDFNGDDFDDLAIGVPDEDIGSVTEAGAVHILYGTGLGLLDLNTQFWQQDDLDGPGNAVGDRFGVALTVIDLPAP